MNKEINDSIALALTVVADCIVKARQAGEYGVVNHLLQAANELVKAKGTALHERRAA